MTLNEATIVARQFGLSRATGEAEADFVRRVSGKIASARAPRRGNWLGLALQVGMFAISMATGTPTPPPDPTA